jgi:outer membrane protein TolC
MMLVKHARNSFLFISGGRVLVTAIGAVVALGCAGTVLYAQSSSSASLPSSPQPNPSSVTNPYYGSVTLHPATNEVLKLSLDDAVVRGLGTNLGLKDAEQGEKTLHGQKLEAMQYFLPTISVSGGTGVNEYNLAAFGFGPSVLPKFASLFPNGLPSNISFITKADVTSGQVNWDQILFSGPVIDAYKGVKAAERAAYFSKESARGEVVQQVAGAYLAVIADQSEVENAKALMDADKVLLDQAHAKHEAGTVPNLDELRARVQFQQQQQRVIDNENKREKAEILLKREIGLAPGQKIVLTDPAPYSELAQRSQDDLRTEAYANRQDYQNMQAQQAELRIVLAARKKERLPTLSFSGNYGVTDVSGIGSHGTLTAMGTLRVPIFQEGTLRGDKDVAQAQLSGVDLQLGDLRGKIDQQIRSALLDVHAEQQLVEVARSNVDLASRALSDETDRFNAGVDDTLPLVQAQASLANAQTSLVESLYQFNLAKLRLARSTGLIELQYRTYLGR